MLQSKLFTRTEKNPPKDETAVNAKLLERGGFVFKSSAGVYSYLPLGWRTIQKVAQIIREEMNAIDGQELFMPALVEKKYWEATGRWDVEVGFEVRGKNEESANFILGWSHEDILTAIVARYIHSYKDLPFAAYQIQTKFRNEARAKSGLLRGREFMMKDLYSFHATEADLDEYYEKTAEAYQKIFNRCGIKAYRTLAGGGVFTSNYTDEFQVVSEVGEDTVYICSKCEYAENKEISKLKDGDKCPKCDGKAEEKKAIEVGNIFRYGEKYAKAVGLQFMDEKGEKRYVVTGAYGIGLGRLMATVVEASHDERGIIWPESVAPYRVHLLELQKGLGKEAYEEMSRAGVEVLYDDRDMSAGEKFADADLIGIPWRAVASEKTGGELEIKSRAKDSTEKMKASEFIKKIS